MIFVQFLCKTLSLIFAISIYTNLAYSMAIVPKLDYLLDGFKTTT